LKPAPPRSKKEARKKSTGYAFSTLKSPGDRNVLGIFCVSQVVLAYDEHFFDVFFGYIRPFDHRGEHLLD
jgi:hypothetical protein